MSLVIAEDIRFEARDMSTLGLARLLEALNDDCACEREDETSCVSAYANPLRCTEGRQFIKDYCRRNRHTANAKHFHPYLECAGPIDRFWLHWHENAQVTSAA